MVKDSRGGAKVICSRFETVAGGSIGRERKLRVHRAQIEEDVCELESDIVLGLGMVGVVTQ